MRARICERITLRKARNGFCVRAASRLTYADRRTFRYRHMFPSSLDGIFQNVNLPYGAMLPAAVVALLALVALAGIVRGGNAWDIAYATYCYFAQAVGVILMVTGAVPVLLAVLSSQLLGNDTYVGLLFVFALGGMLFLWHDVKLRHIDAAAKAVPGALFFFTWKLIGLMVGSYALLTLAMTTVVYLSVPGTSFPVQNAMVHVTMLAMGLGLGWFTQMPRGTRPSVTTRTLAPLMPTLAAKAKKPVAKKAPAKKKKK